MLISVNGTTRAFESVYGVDFSGAKQAGRNIWLARLDALRAGPKGRGKYRLTELASLEQLCGSADRAPALQHLVDLIRSSEQALWAMDFPFSLPVEVMPARSTWPDQLAFLRRANDDAYGVGLECLDRARNLGGPLHIRPLTDTEARTPFDCYHYRIIYQYFYGVRDVLGPLWASRGTAVLPFQYARLSRASRVLVEACPSSTLKRLALRTKTTRQPAGGPADRQALRTRRTIVDGLSRLVPHRRPPPPVLMRNPGGTPSTPCWPRSAAHSPGSPPTTTPSPATRATPVRAGSTVSEARTQRRDARDFGRTESERG
jgi:hypothetical protein